VKCAVLFSGGKDSVFAAYLTKKHRHKISCLISIISENPESYMFHTPTILKVGRQAEVMNIPLILQKTKGQKEKELKDLENAIKNAKTDFDIESVVTGSVESAYQASRVQRICDNLNLDCFNPLWQKDQFGLLKDLIKNKFKIIITGVFAYPLNETWLGREINYQFIQEVTSLNKKYKINPAGEGGEYETFVLNCPLFTHKLKIKDEHIHGKNNAWKMEIDLV
jgi:ABC transporter with metal-binding/Fe-S-binding domain ATP-binding protein